MGMCLILNSYRDRLVWIYWPNSVRSLCVGLDEQCSLHKKSGYTRRIYGSHFGWCCPDLKKKTWKSTRAKITRSSRMSCKVRWTCGGIS